VVKQAKMKRQSIAKDTLLNRIYGRDYLNYESRNSLAVYASLTTAQLCSALEEDSAVLQIKL